MYLKKCRQDHPQKRAYVLIHARARAHFCAYLFLFACVSNGSSKKESEHSKGNAILGKEPRFIFARMRVRVFDLCSFGTHM